MTECVHIDISDAPPRGRNGRANIHTVIHNVIHRLRSRPSISSAYEKPPPRLVAAQRAAPHRAGTSRPISPAFLSLCPPRY